MSDSPPRTPVRSRRRFLALPVTLALAACLGASTLAMLPDAAQAESEGKKAYWQDRYRNLLRRKAELRSQIETERALYAAANRRNYRRGPVRHEHLEKVREAEKELATVEAALETFVDDARRDGALPGWLYEVEEEQLVRTGGSDSEDVDDRGGRNPKFLSNESAEDS